MKPGRLQLAGRYLRHRFRRLRPFEVQASVTNQCNLRCHYCACHTLAGPELTTEQWMEVMAALRKLGCGRFKFQGGEPTTRPDFKPLAAEVKRLDMICAITTNGINIAEDPGLLSHLDEVVISLDSHRRENHDRLRGQGTHQTVLRAIDHCQRAGKKTLINMVVSRVNYTDLEGMLAFCQERGLFFNAQPMVSGKVFYGSGNDDIMLSLDEIQRMNLTLAQWKTQGEPVMFSAPSYRHAAAWSDYENHLKMGHPPSRCIGGKSYLHIEPNGDVFPCSFHVGGNLTVKNLLADGLQAAMLRAGEHGCRECWIPYLNERRALAGLRPGAVWAYLARGRGHGS